MTVQQKKSKIDYIADGKAKNFIIPFYFLEKQIAVYVSDKKEPLTEGVDYHIINNQNQSGGEIEFIDAPKNNTKVTIIRNVPLNQLITFIEGENFPASDYETSLDKIVMALQMIEEVLDRTLKLDVISSYTIDEFKTLIEDINKEFDLIKKVPALSGAINAIYEELLTISTDDVDEKNKGLITSKGVATHLKNSYYTKDMIDTLTTKKYGPISIDVSNIIKSDTYNDYPYHADIELISAKSTDVPTIILNIDDAISNNFAPISESFDGYIRIYLKNIPQTSTIEIPIILLQ
jgi:hypothetical protein